MFFLRGKSVDPPLNELYQGKVRNSGLGLSHKAKGIQNFYCHSLALNLTLTVTAI